jgi:UDP-GlcNAc3NAcA epimerase
MRVLSVVGNRPQFIKSAPLSVALRSVEIDEVVVHTGQHYDRELSEVFFDELGLAEPQHELGLQTADPGAMRPRLGDVMRAEKPDAVLVYGDTNSTLAGAQAAADADIPLVHVEAGLRSGDLAMPEERNRIEVDRLSALLFAPDDRSRDTLEAEGVSGHVEVVGDVMADACFRFAPIARERSDALERFGVSPRGYVLVTLHRAANVEPQRLERIVAGLNGVGERIIFPAHPRTRAALHGLRTRFEVSQPLGYLDFAALAAQARVIATDSGGLQKEAYWYGVPCVTLRPSTEWVDTVELGANVLVDDDPVRIRAALAGTQMPAELPQLYGDGHASERIARSLVDSLSRA